MRKRWIRPFPSSNGCRKTKPNATNVAAITGSVAPGVARSSEPNPSSAAGFNPQPVPWLGRRWLRLEICPIVVCGVQMDKSRARRADYPKPCGVATARPWQQHSTRGRARRCRLQHLHLERPVCDRSAIRRKPCPAGVGPGRLPPDPRFDAGTTRNGERCRDNTHIQRFVLERKPQMSYEIVVGSVGWAVLLNDPTVLNHGPSRTRPNHGSDGRRRAPQAQPGNQRGLSNKDVRADGHRTRIRSSC